MFPNFAIHGLYQNGASVTGFFFEYNVRLEGHSGHDVTK